MCYGIELKKGMVNRLECTKNDVPSKKILNIFAPIPIIRGGGGGGGGGGGERGSSQC